MILEFQIDRPKILWRQVAEQLRGKIMRGELAPGTRLPSTTQLASQTGTNVSTVHQALSDLVRAGLVTRARKVGTFVTERKLRLSSIGIYQAYRSGSESYGGFLQMLTQEIQHQAHSRDITARIWTDPRPREEQVKLLAPLGKAAQEREMDGLITTISDPQHTTWLMKLPVPVAYLGCDFPSSVNADDIQLITDSLASLKQQGARSVGVIVPHFPADRNLSTSFQMECKALGLDTRPEWIFALKKVDEAFLDPIHEQYGYETFQRLWAQKERPEGLIVFPDGVARGALLALMDRQVRVPEELKLVFHRNAGAPFFCPVEAAFAVTPVREIASALLQQLDTVFQGRSPQSILVKSQIQAGLQVAPV